MLPPLSFPAPPPLTLLLLLAAPPDPGWTQALRRLSAAIPDAEPLLRGHGPPERLAPALRALAGEPMQPRVELGTHAEGTAAALVAGVRAARSPWVLWLPHLDDEAATGALLLRRQAEAAGAGVFFRDRTGACLFRRELLLQLPRIPGMHRLLPELFARQAAAAAVSGGRPLHRAYVAFACTMGLGWTPERRTA